MFFLFGFMLLAALFAAAAAMVSRQEDIGSTTTPLTMLIMAPYFLVIFFNDNPTVLAIMSYVPFSAPVGMPMRLFLGEAQWWEPILSLAILIATCIARDPDRREDLRELAAAHGGTREAPRGAAGLTARCDGCRGPRGAASVAVAGRSLGNIFRRIGLDDCGPTATRPSRIEPKEVAMTIPLLNRTAETDAPVLDVLADRWSPGPSRRTTDRRAQLASALEAARWAPSANNIQPWRFIVARRGTAGPRRACTRRCSASTRLGPATPQC